MSLLKKKELPLQVVLLLLAGVAMLLVGMLSFFISAGRLPFYEKGLYGVLLFMVALQMVVLGETPFGCVGKSTSLLTAGTTLAAIGIITCFIPNILGEFPRLLLVVCLMPGGAFLLLKMMLAKENYRTWRRYGGIFRHLIWACGLVYALSFFTGVALLRPRFLSILPFGAVSLFYGVALMYLAWVLHTLYIAHPESQLAHEAKGALAPAHAVLLITGVFMILLGALLVPVSLGLLPFSGSAQLGLLMVLFAVQMLAFGETPLGPFPRTGLTLSCGLLFGGLGIISCVVPNVLVPVLTVLIAALNIFGGGLMLGKTVWTLYASKKEQGPALPGLLKKLYATQLFMSLLSVLFGVSMLISHLFPGYVIGVILGANGAVLIYLLHLLLGLEINQAAASGRPAA
ncbi:MAG: hypothetical protein PHG65_03910 [Kiritimatiellae bacterium]|nr:hypothetical protein [Kiritimatiellia bacterium]